MKRLNFVLCKDCQCNRKNACYRLPPTPFFACDAWRVRYPPIIDDAQGCFSGIDLKAVEDE